MPRPARLLPAAKPRGLSHLKQVLKQDLRLLRYGAIMEIMSFNLRLTPNLELRAKARAEELGISLNAIISVALDAYLGGVPHGNHGDNTKSTTVVKSATLKPSPGDPVVGLTKKQRQQYTASTRAQRKLAL